MTTYYSVIVRTHDCDEWHVHYGSYVRDECKDEMVEVKRDPDVRDWAIMKSGDSQSEIENELARLNKVLKN